MASADVVSVALIAHARGPGEEEAGDRAGLQHIVDV